MIHQGDVRLVLPTLPAESVQMVCTSPPYWGLRDYGVEGQIGLEASPDAYVAELVAVFREIKRVLKDDGVAWLNLGDSYSQSGRGGNPDDSPHRKQATNRGSISVGAGSQLNAGFHEVARQAGAVSRAWSGKPPDGLKPKDLVGIPWRVAFALQADGWYLRSDIIWAKPNPMPESVKDRPTRSHEYVFLLTKSARYFYDAEAIAEPVSDAMLLQIEQGYDGLGLKDYESAGVQEPSSVKARIIARARARSDHGNTKRQKADPDQEWQDGVACAGSNGITRNARTVWTINPQPFPDAHFATFPEELAERCVKAGSREGDTVLDPFAGAGTVGVVCARYGREFVGIELNPAYAQMAENRIADTMPLLRQA